MAGEKRAQRLKSVLRKHGGEWRWLEATKMKLVVDREEPVVVDCRHISPGRLQDCLIGYNNFVKAFGAGEWLLFG
ncbi:hypothetical protein WN943_018745 [Citrus x changshan-huyou]